MVKSPSTRHADAGLRAGILLPLLLLLLLLLGCFGLHMRAVAEAPIVQVSAEQQGIARAAYRAGVRAFERGEHAQALERFAIADDAVSSPNAKLMRARCLAQLGRAAEAYVMYSATVNEATMSGDRRYDATASTAAEEALALEPQIALIMLTVDDETEHAVLAVNGEPLERARWNEVVSVSPGPVVVTLTGPDGQQDRVERTMMAGTRARLDLAIEAGALQPTDTSVTLASHAAGRPSQHTAQVEGGGLPALPVVIGAAGVAGLVSFAVFGAMSNAELDTLERDCPAREQCDPALADTASRGRTYQTIANVSLGAGLVLLATGATLLVLELPSDGVEVAILPNGARVRGAL